MGSVTILEETPKNPITLIGQRAGVCWGADVSDPNKNYQRGLDCLQSNHGRTFEYVDINSVIDGYSAKVIREWYTHIGGSPTRLQASTRYLNYQKGFDFIIPHTIQENEKALELYNEAIVQIQDSLKKLDILGIPREDSSMILPICMSTKIVDKRNLRNIIDMSHQRKCARAYWEFRELFTDYEKALREYSEEWEYVVDNYFIPKCKLLGHCIEKNPCYNK